MDYDELRDQVQAFFSDTSRAPRETRNDLKALVGEIEGMVEAIEIDLARDGDEEEED